MKILAVSNQKGGVGKTTTAVTLGHRFAQDGRRVLLIDLDPQGQSAIALGLEQEPCAYGFLTFLPPAPLVRPARERLDIIPGNKRTGVAQTLMQSDPENFPLDAILQAVKPLASAYDVIVFDTSPSVGGLQERAIFAADLVLAPTSTEYMALDGFSQTFSTLSRLVNRGWKGKLAIIPTFYDHTKESAVALNHMTEHFPHNTLPPIRRATVLRECAAEGKTIWEYAPESPVAADWLATIKGVKL